MRKLVLLKIGVAFALCANAQISITNAALPAKGTRIINYDANVPNPPFTFNKAGKVNTWDFTTVAPVPNADDTIYWNAPAGSPGASAFPTADIATYETGDATESFLKVDATGVYFLGLGGDILGNGNVMGLPFSPTVKAASFPFTLGSKSNATGVIQFKVTGSSIGQSSVDSVWFHTTNKLNSEVIASGNIVLPSGTFPCLLELQKPTSIDSTRIKGSATGGQWILAPSFPKTKQDSTYYWYTAQSLEPAAHVIYKSGAITDVTYFKSVALTGINEIISANSLQLFPNPASDLVTLSAGNKIIKSLSVVDLTGALVFTVETPGHTINLAGLRPGVYFLKVYCGDSASQFKKFVKL